MAPGITTLSQWVNEYPWKRQYLFELWNVSRKSSRAFIQWLIFILPPNYFLHLRCSGSEVSKTYHNQIKYISYNMTVVTLEYTDKAVNSCNSPLLHLYTAHAHRPAMGCLYSDYFGRTGRKNTRKIDQVIPETIGICVCVIAAFGNKIKPWCQWLMSQFGSIRKYLPIDW